MIRLGKFRITLPDEEFVWEPDEVTVGEGLMIEGEFGGTYIEWLRAVHKEQTPAVQILIWFLRRKAGRHMDRLSVDFKIRYLEIEPVVEPGEEDDPGPEASAGSEPATSPSSPTGSESDPGSGSGSPSLTSVA